MKTPHAQQKDISADRLTGNFSKGPRIVSLARADALLQTTALGKSTFWAHAEADDRKKSFATSRDPEDHRVRRRPWEVAFSPKHLSKQDAVVQQAIGLFIDRLAVDSASAAHAAVNITDAISRLTFDVTGIIGFGHSFGATTRAGDKPHPALTDLRKAHAVLGTLRFVPWLLSLLLKVPGGGGDFASFLKLCEDVMNEHRAERRDKQKFDNAGKDAIEEEEADLEEESRGQNGGRPKPVVSFLLDALERGDPSAAPTPEALADESRSMIAAGADTTQSAMTNVLGFVAARRDIQAQLQKLVDVSFPQGPASFTYAALLAAPETLGWIDAVIHETLRIQPSAPTANPRVTPPQGLEIDESVFGPRIWIPGDVEIVQSPYVIHRDARWFERPDEFLPERWFTGSNIQCDRGAYFPFHLGKRWRDAKSWNSFLDTPNRKLTGFALKIQANMHALGSPWPWRRCEAYLRGWLFNSTWTWLQDRTGANTKRKSWTTSPCRYHHST